MENALLRKEVDVDELVGDLFQFAHAVLPLAMAYLTHKPLAEKTLEILSAKQTTFVSGWIARSLASLP